MAQSAVPRVLLVTGAYHPEISSGGQQCRDVARELNGRAVFSVLTTALDPSLPLEEHVDNVRVFRVPIDVRDRRSRRHAVMRVGRLIARLRADVDIVHIHGVSSKNVPVTLLARAFGLPVVLTMHTAGQDEPDAVAQRGPLSRWAFGAAHRVLSVSPVLTAKYLAAGMPQNRLRETINGIDTRRFAPTAPAEQQALKAALGLPPGPVVLFVGFFSRDKRPDVLFDAWMQLAATSHPDVALVCVGASRASYFEIDPTLAERMHGDAARAGVAERLRIVDPTPHVDQYFKAADVFALPSAREAMPLALLEAMSCALPVVASRLPGATDVIIDEGVNGILVPPGDVTALARSLGRLLDDRALARELGTRARSTVESRYGIPRAAQDWLEVYSEVLAA